MGIFFISMKNEKREERIYDIVSVPYGDLFYFYFKNLLNNVRINKFPSPTGIFFVSIKKDSINKEDDKISFRPLRGSFLFLSCPMETLPGLEKTCTLRCKKFSPAKSGDLKLFKCSVPPILCPAVQNYDSTSSIFPIP